MPKKDLKGPPKGRRGRDASPLPSDLEDEVEKFHKKKDVLKLNVEEDSDSEDSLDDEGVYDLSEEEEEEEGDDDEEYDTDEEIANKTRIGKCEPTKK
jgi:hypothetical protein